MPGGRLDKHDAARAARRSMAVDLYVQGWSVRKIASQLGCGHATAARDVNEALAEMHAARVESVAHHVAVQEERLGVILSAALEMLANADDPDLRLRAADRVLRAEERRAKLLGLDAPSRSELVGKVDTGPAIVVNLTRAQAEALADEPDDEP